jgi:RNA polymerase sigma-70 factor (ECF subfamily)
MLYIAEGILHDKAQAEDAVSEAFVRIIYNLDKIDMNDCYKTKGFVVIVTRNTSYDILKKQSRFIPIEKLPDCFGEADAVFNEISVKEACGKISEAITGLNKAYADILYLKLYMDYTNEETAQILGISKANAIVRYNRAKNALKKRLREDVTL